MTPILLRIPFFEIFHEVLCHCKDAICATQYQCLKHQTTRVPGSRHIQYYDEGLYYTSCKLCAYSVATQSNIHENIRMWIHSNFITWLIIIQNYKNLYDN